MKRVFSGILLTLLCTHVFSQSGGAIRGSVSDGKDPLEFSNAFIASFPDTTKVLKITASDSLGRFEFDNLPYGNYILKISLIGYLPARFSVRLDSLNSIFDIPTLQLKPDAKFLNTVDVVTHKDLIKKTPQGFVIMAKDNLTQAGGTATDLLKNTPTIVVDAEGGITVRGKSPLILINGRNSGLTNTDRIPASSVESIEIINNPGAQYDADAEGGIINIKLKKNTDKGTNGSVVLGGGYGAKGRINSSFALNHQTSKWNFALAYDNRFANRTRKVEGSRINSNLPEEYSLVQHRHDGRYEQTQNLKFNIDFTPNDKNNFSLELIANTDGVDNDEFLITQLRTQTDSFQFKNTRRSIELAREKTAEFAFYYSRKFKDPNKYLNMSLTSSLDLDRENTDITSQSLYENDALLGNPFLQRTHNYQTGTISNFRIDHAQPLGKKGILETGYKGILRNTDADYQSLYFQNSDYVVNPKSSNDFNFLEQIHAVYAQYKGFVGNADSAKLKYDLGLRVEQMSNESKLGDVSVVKRNYLNFFPTGNLAYYLNQNDFLKLSFTRRINRPDLERLNPFLDITDSLNPHNGNPYLKPELSNALEAGYNRELKKVSLSVNVFYRYTTNIIRSYTTLFPNGVALITPVNFGNLSTYGIEGIASVFPAKFWSANISVSAFQQSINGSNVRDDIATNVFSWYGKLINNFTLWKGSKLQVIANYNSPVGTPQGKTIEIYYADLGFQQKLFKNRAALGIVVTDMFNTQRKGSTSYTSDFSNYRYSKIDTRAVLFTFAYSFGTSFKEELMENKFSND
jgi:outer membrane receptor protein involved in Fe transport